MRLLVTGGLGFMGSDFIRYLINKDKKVRIINLDKMTYAANPANLASVSNSPYYKFIKGDIADPKAVAKAFRLKPNYIVNFAAETHVDRSILDPEAFIRTDVLGTYQLLSAALKHKIKKFLQISTDEVYGMTLKGLFYENSPLKPNSPYSASKASGDLLVCAFNRTWGLPTLITRSCNNFGPYQYPEKIIPLFITNLIENKKVPVYGKGNQVREWIYVRDHSRAVETVLKKGKTGEVYNIGTGYRIPNIKLTKMILKFMGKDLDMIEYVKDRPGHDVRYALSATKLKKLGWKPQFSFQKALRETIKWYQENPSWWLKIKSGEYLKYYRKQYKK